MKVISSDKRDEFHLFSWLLSFFSGQIIKMLIS